MNLPPSERRESGFQWDAERRFPLVFAGLLFLSLLVHAATFFVFQITYPQRVTIPPLAPQVTVLSPDLPEHQQLLAWIASEDPALSAATARASAPGIQQLPYQPSYAAVRTLPRSAPRQMEPVPLPPGRSGLELIEAVALEKEVPKTTQIRSATTMVISEPLAARAMEGNFELHSSGSEPLQPAEFLLGVNKAGEVRYTFLHRSSGDSTADDAAAAQLSKLTFSQDSQEITWGFVTISWGDDVYQQNAPPSRQPESTR